MTGFDAVPLEQAIVDAKPPGMWTRVCAFIAGPGILRIETDPGGRWSYAAGTVEDCGADGDPSALVSRKECLCPDAPVGALIGKIGGSSAGIADVTVFPVGTSCQIRIPDDGGALFLTINDTVDGMGNNGGTLTVTSVMRADAAKSEKPAPG